ncbi:MAG: DUF2306 domain-containing protein [Anaerolineales bacterium]|nr:DUF2306 domain-containing protein [Anaerolineales bacterium]
MTAKTITKRKSAAWFVPAGLVLLSVPPLIFGALRLMELAGGPRNMPANPLFVATPWPVVIHILSAAVFALAGAFQFVTGWRKRAFGWHRAAGRVLVVCGLLVALSGLWMTLFFPRPSGPNDLLYALRLVFSSAMVVSIVLGFEAIIRRRDVLAHRAWMMRGYAIGLGAATQVLTGMVASFIVSEPSALSTALSQGAGWVINLAIAEWAIRRLPAQRAAVAQAARLMSERAGAAR